MNTAICPDFTLEAVYESMASLPVFPKIVHRALKVLDDPNKNITDVGKIIKLDHGLVANILKLTNSAMFGLSQQVSDLDTALALLGQNKIREVLIASAAMPYLARDLNGYEMSPEDLCYHSIGCAMISEVVSKRLGFANSAELFTAAILHDIGKIVLDIYVGPRLMEVLDRSRREDSDFSVAEWEVIGTDHAIAGSSILQQWEFPRDICRAVRAHHDPDLYIQDRLSAMLALCNILSVQLGLGVGADGFRYRLSDQLLYVLDCDEKDYFKCLEDAVKALEDARDVIQLIFG
ncbi:MAG: HDOD domain-containing protein [Thermodesulfobacteria bacterium]|nr:HDOD domain-containing protein [Thermodesulfobacteriota bacterium]